MTQPNQTVELTFSISDKKLKGKILGRDFSAAAVSGGGANKNRSDPDLSNNPDLTMVKSKRLSRGVGRGQPNRCEDVLTVQRMLNALVPSPRLVPDGRYGPRTAAAIERFQRSIGFRRPDGWIASGGKTYRALLQKSRHYSYTKYVFSPAVITPSSASPGHIRSGRVSDRGGSPPIGKYILDVSAGTPPGRIRMLPQFPTHRSGLQIHFAGPIGSDGCIALMTNSDVQTLRRAVQRIASGRATLEVVR